MAPARIFHTGRDLREKCGLGSRRARLALSALLAIAVGLNTLGTVRAQSVPDTSAPSHQAKISRAALPAPVGLFGALEFQASSPVAVPQWTRVVERLAVERAAVAACGTEPRDCGPRVLEWRATLQSLRGRNPIDQLREINRFANRIVPYRLDDANFGARDYWASPLEFLRRAGDCEDFSIFKFASLLELGFSDDQMRIVVVWDTLRRLPHAVLAVDLDGQTYILDSQSDIVLPHDRITQYRPQYSVNMTRRWAHVPVTGGSGR